MTTSTLINTIQVPSFSPTGPRPSPLPARFSEGWHHTERYGDVFVTPGGSAWLVQQSGDQLINVTVTPEPSDIIKTPAIARVKHAQAMRRYRKTRAPITSMPNLPLSEAEGVDK